MWYLVSKLPETNLYQVLFRTSKEIIFSTSCLFEFVLGIIVIDQFEICLFTYTKMLEIDKFQAGLQTIISKTFTGSLEF